MSTNKDAVPDITRAEFERACSFLPPEFVWGLPVTPRLVLDVARAALAARSGDDAAPTLTAIDADMVWPDDDGEAFYHSIDDAIECEVDNAHPCRDEFEIKLSLGKRISTATVRVFNITERGHEWEIVPASATAASGGDQA